MTKTKSQHVSVELHFQISGSALAYVRGCIPPYHTFEGKSGRFLGCGAFPTAAWQHSQR